MKTITKKEVKELLNAGKLTELKKYIITDGSTSDTINALHLLMAKKSDEYYVSFESLPYSRGGKYKRHTSTLSSIQKWEVKVSPEGNYYVDKSSTSKSVNCPTVIVPKFYTEIGREYHNRLINIKIDDLKKQLI